MSHIYRKLGRGLSFGLLTLLSLKLHAAGYKLEFQSASTLADAGDAAVVEDAGTNWYNSAGLTDLPQQLVMSGIDLYQQTKFHGSTTAPVASPYSASSFSANGTASSYPNPFLPAVHYTYPFHDRWAVGVSVVPAWGLMEDYGQNSLLRYDLMRIYTKTIDVAPSLAFKINPQWSVGVGPDFNYFYVSSKSAARTEPATPGDSLSKFSADDWNTGWHAGLLFHLSDATRIGLNYRSKIIMHTKGYSDFELNGASLYETNQFTLNVPLPPTTSLSAYQQLSSRLAVMGTLAYDQWGILKSYNAQNFQSITALGQPKLVNVSLVQNMKNTLDWGVGMHYILNDQWLLRANVKYEPTPTVDAYRDVNFPDGDKVGVQIGARYQINKKLAVDMLYGHVFVQSTPIQRGSQNPSNPLTGATATGHVNTSIDLAGAQLVWDI